MLAASAPIFFLIEECMFAAMFTQLRVREFGQSVLGEQRISVGQSDLSDQNRSVSHQPTWSISALYPDPCYCLHFGPAKSEC